jgi:hypothetical protein
MLKFSLKLLLFFSPLIPLFGFPFFVFWQARELTSLDDVLKAQSGSHEVLYGLAYDYNDRTYKEEMTAERDPQVVALGNSRIMEVRQQFFQDPETFVNAGGASSKLAYAISFVRSLPKDTHVKVILFDVDGKFFVVQKADGPEQITPWERFETFLSVGWRTIYLDYFSGKFTLSQFASRTSASPAIGLNALIDNVGYLNDGSHYDGAVVESATRAQGVENADRSYASTIRRLDQSGAIRDIPELPEEHFTELKTFLSLCKEKGIYVIGQFPPISYSALTKNDNSAIDPYTVSANVIVPRLQGIFSQFGFPLFNYQDATSVGIKETEFLDTDHPSDKAELRMLIDMAEHDKVLARYVNLPDLQALLRDTKGDFVFDQKDL